MRVVVPSADPSACPSKRQYATVPGTSICAAGRAARAGTGANPAKRCSKSTLTVKRSTSPERAASPSASSLPVPRPPPRMNGERVSTSIAFRSRSTWYSRIIAAPP